MRIPAVRVGAGAGAAVRTKDLIAWFALGPGIDPAPLVRSLVLAAGSARELPVARLMELAESTPELSLAVVWLSGDAGQAWVCGEAVVTIDGAEDRTRVAAGGQPAAQRTFAVPCYALRLGDPEVTDTWSHLIEGAVPAGGVAVVWEEAARTEPVPVVRRGAVEPPVGARFEAVALLAAEPAEAGKPLPLASEESEEEAMPARVEVAGLKCSRGHFNHPHAANCAWCGIGMIQVSHIMIRMSRPSLGVLVIDGRATFTLDAEYVLGRQPQVRSEVDGGRVREIVLSADRAISRAHAAIRLVDWDVVVEDLGSGIGTWIQQPHQPPFQLRPGQPVPLAPGAVVHIGPHRITFHSHFLR